MFAAAVCLGCALPGQHAELNRKVAAALKRARPVLVHQLKSAKGQVVPLVCLAAIDELPITDKALQHGLARAWKSRRKDTYFLSLRLMLAAKLAAKATDKKKAVLLARAQQDAEHLLRNRHGGAFGYHSRHRGWDLSNTQYGVLGLRAATSLGVKIEAAAWLQVATSVSKAQHEDGSFGYVAKAKATAGMTVAGIAVLQICLHKVPARSRKELRLPARLASAWRWMEARSQQVGTVKPKSPYYFHYGLERAAILAGRKKVGGVDWYVQGATMLLKAQQRRGGWFHRDERKIGGRDSSTGANEVTTAFAVLFLRRGFRKVLPPITPSGRR